MPRDLKSEDEFRKLLESAVEVRRRDSGGDIKLKIRTKRRLYTLETTKERADQLLKNIKVKLVEL